MVDEAAKAAGTIAVAGDPVMLFHGTSSFGFTQFLPGYTGAIYTSTRSNVSANYAGDANYASVRNIGRKAKGDNSTEDLLVNMENIVSVPPIFEHRSSSMDGSRRYCLG